MRLIFIRHAETESNVAGIIDTGVPGPGLTPLGSRQADALVNSLAGEDIDAIYASTQVRTAHTAGPLARARHLEVATDSGFGEISAGSLAMRGDPPAIDCYVGVLGAWVGGELSSRMPGGEDGHEFLGRFDAALARIRSSGCRTAAVFSHGGAIRTWTLIRARNADAAVDVNCDIENTEAIHVMWTGSVWEAVRSTVLETAPCVHANPLPDFE
ncbi:histidine phosphatase family protein [Mycobacterium sp. AZCC_0083]|uniref:histidine phosphatase family protein n=1 Tax=Mycobacterium sp. AZCC_0083 TaxID=2735882 RepID=UPI001616E260|nr:histidine phosphatase family protein [Mycobacterium sp. AZCC_0083]MBB5164023.1 putative phosphoglycerate mutase [Mycobacterium sp. AZCC_0083]